jgi:acetylornithine deacetylase/succinyl-diaminopimelate desuccinylase-like protein
MPRLALGLGLAAMMFVGSPGAQNGEDRLVAALTENPAVKMAMAWAGADEPRTIDDQVRFSEIAAPPFMEAARGDELRRVFQQLGLQRVRVDRAGNILGERPGAAPRPHLVVAAHLDTVFPEGTSVKVTREGAILRGPGIGDNSRGLAVLVATVRAMNRATIQTPGSITFVADVGEEGLGDLRGMKQLFDDTLRGTVDRFVTIDGSGMGLAYTFLGSHRYRVTFKGPGGHSFGAFGTPSPVGAMGRAVAKISEFQVPAGSQTTFNVGRIGGGTSVNSIPSDAWMEVDLRSVERAALAALDVSLDKALNAAVAEENARWRRPGVVTMTRQLVGDRPAVATPADSFVVQAALAATRALGAFPLPNVSSSDANYPASLRISSIEIGGGGRMTGAHSPSEAFDTTDSWLGTGRALLLTIALAQR